MNSSFENAFLLGAVSSSICTLCIGSKRGRSALRLIYHIFLRLSYRCPLVHIFGGLASPSSFE